MIAAIVGVIIMFSLPSQFAAAGKVQIPASTQFRQYSAALDMQLGRAIEALHKAQSQLPREGQREYSSSPAAIAMLAADAYGAALIIVEEHLSAMDFFGVVRGNLMDQAKSGVIDSAHVDRMHNLFEAIRSGEEELAACIEKMQTSRAKLESRKVDVEARSQALLQAMNELIWRVRGEALIERCLELSLKHSQVAASMVALHDEAVERFNATAQQHRFWRDLWYAIAAIMLFVWGRPAVKWLTEAVHRLRGRSTLARRRWTRR